LGKGVTEATLERLPVTLSLSAYALALTVLFGLTLGIFAALRQNSWVDQMAMMVAMIGISLPNFWLGLMMIIVFAVHLGWLPTGGYVNFTDDPWNWLRAMTMPAISLAALQMGLLARITRSTMLEVLRQDYVRTARAKGLPTRLVIGKHALAATMIPVLTVIGIIVNLPALCCRRHGDDLLGPWAGAASHLRDLQSRLSAGPGRAASRDGRHDDRQHPGRHRLRLCRSARPFRDGVVSTPS